MMFVTVSRVKLFHETLTNIIFYCYFVSIAILIKIFVYHLKYLYIIHIVFILET